MKKKIIFAASLIALFVAIFVGSNIQKAEANPLSFTPSIYYPAQATTTLVYLSSSGTASFNYDTYYAGSSTPSGFKTDGATLLLQTTASSTSSVYTVSYNFSQDGQEYYADNISQPATTSTFSLGGAYNYKLFAVGTTRAFNAIPVPTPTRFVKVTVTASGAPGAFWAQLVPAKQVHE